MQNNNNNKETTAVGRQLVKVDDNNTKISETKALDEKEVEEHEQYCWGSSSGWCPDPQQIPPYFVNHHPMLECEQFDEMAVRLQYELCGAVVQRAVDDPSILKLLPRVEQHMNVSLKSQNPHGEWYPMGIVRVLHVTRQHVAGHNNICLQLLCVKKQRQQLPYDEEDEQQITQLSIAHAEEKEKCSWVILPCPKFLPWFGLTRADICVSVKINILRPGTANRLLRPGPGPIIHQQSVPAAFNSVADYIEHCVQRCCEEFEGYIDVCLLHYPKEFNVADDDIENSLIAWRHTECWLGTGAHSIYSYRKERFAPEIYREMDRIAEQFCLNKSQLNVAFLLNRSERVGIVPMVRPCLLGNTEQLWAQRRSALKQLLLACSNLSNNMLDTLKKLEAFDMARPFTKCRQWNVR